MSTFNNSSARESNDQGIMIGTHVDTSTVVGLYCASSYIILVLWLWTCHAEISAKLEEEDPDTVYETMDRFLTNMANEKPQRYTSLELAKYTRGYLHKLGSGGFGVVYRGWLPDLGVPIAVKVLNNDLNKQVEEQVKAEINAIARTYHINLVKLYGYCFDPKLKALVYEFMPNGSLDRLLFGPDKAALDWDKLYNIAIGTAKGIAYLHEECEQKIIHHDIKPGNVLLDADLNPKVGDFGLARLSSRDISQLVMTGFKGTPGYAAPEVWTPYVSHKCDVYSFGMLLFEIVGRRRNLDRDLGGTSKEWFPRWSYEKVVRDNEVEEMLQECRVEERCREKAERAVRVALWCVQYSPKARPEMGVVVKMLEGVVEMGQPPNPFGYLENTLERRDWSATTTEGPESENETMKQFSTYPRVLERRIDVDLGITS